LHCTSAGAILTAGIIFTPLRSVKIKFTAHVKVEIPPEFQVAYGDRF
jgi:hypothetical protein